MNKSKTASQYEQLIEYILNDENDKARALFHDIVVNRSRKIYENILDETDLEEAPMDPTMADEGMGMGHLEDEVEEDQKQIHRQIIFVDADVEENIQEKEEDEKSPFGVL